MTRNRIRNREDLAREIGEPPTNVRRAFTTNWQGTPTVRMMAALSYKFNTPVNNLITDPRRTRTAVRVTR
ncbi:Uncharacterised protein [Mycobacteroides abscessus subsp. abscessus]|nr:Uncharacterised protein [Mycobacteroides abscessus subsp. abscessus]